MSKIIQCSGIRMWKNEEREDECGTVKPAHNGIP
jgi:hypothetical protein